MRRSTYIDSFLDVFFLDEARYAKGKRQKRATLGSVAWETFHEFGGVSSCIDGYTTAIDGAFAWLGRHFPE